MGSPTESLQDFLSHADRETVTGMRQRNAIPQWDSAHPHGMMITKGEGPYLEGSVERDGEVMPVKVIDGHGQILCNSAGYKNQEIEEAREVARRGGVDAIATNFHHPIVEWSREALLNTLPPAWRDLYKLYFATSGTEANDTLRRLALAQGNGQASFVNLRAGYSGAGYAANAACGNPGWKGNSTPDIVGMHFTDPNPDDLMRVLSDIPSGRSVAAMFEAGNYGVGGFYDIPDDFLKQLIEKARSRTGGAYPDEVQTGLGRTGTTFWASERIFEGMEPPEGISLAKGVGGNHRGAAIFVRENIAAKAKGLIYNTFAQNAEDLAAMGTVVNMAQRDNWPQNAADRGVQLSEGFERVVRPASRIDFSTHGRGLMFGVRLDTANRVNAVLRRAPLDGWVCGKGGVDGRVLRIAPPINVTEQVTNDLLEAVARTFASAEVERAA